MEGNEQRTSLMILKSLPASSALTPPMSEQPPPTKKRRRGSRGGRRRSRRTEEQPPPLLINVEWELEPPSAASDGLEAILAVDDLEVEAMAILLWRALQTGSAAVVDEGRRYRVRDPLSAAVRMDLSLLRDKLRELAVMYRDSLPVERLILFPAGFLAQA